MISNKVIFVLLLMGFVFFQSCKKDKINNNTYFPDEILLSPIADLEIFQGTRTKVFLSAIDANLENVSFTCIDPPSYVFLSPVKNGSCILTIDVPFEKTGIVPLLLQVVNGLDSTIINFDLSIKKQEGPIYYCDPSQQSNKGKGTIEDPFGSLESIMNQDLENGAHYLLLKGFHGHPIITHSNIFIAAAAKNEPDLSGISISNASQVVLSGLNISAHHNKEFSTKNYLIHIDSASTNVSIQNCLIESFSETKNWTENNWNTKAAKGIKCQAPNSVIQNNLIQNIFHGIKTENSNIQVKYNTIDRFSGDAIRNIGSHNSYNFNLLKNAVLDDYYAPEGNHDDLFQSWTFDLPIENVELKNNISISCLEPDLPLKSKVVQGLVCFDGFVKNWIIENNLVITDHPHGIALYGAENCKIINNTVLRNPLRLFQFESDPWIMVNNHKDGRASENCDVTNNLSTAIKIVSNDVLENNNLIIDSSFVDIFVDYKSWDFRKKKIN